MMRNTSISLALLVRTGRRSALALLALFLFSATVRGETYRVHNLDLASWLPTEGILTIDLTHEMGKGTYAALLGYPQIPVEVRSFNSAPGVMDFEFRSGSWRQMIRTYKRIEGTKLVWSGYREGDENSSNAWLYRNTSDDLSVAQKTLTYSDCGSHYGAIQYELAKTATPQMVESWIRSHPILSELPPQDPFEDGDRKYTDFAELVASTTATSIPVGSEVYIITELRKSGFFESVDMDVGGCGGADRSYFTVLKESLFNGDMFSEIKFKDYILARLNQFLSGGEKFNFEISNTRLTTVRVPPYPVALTLQLIAASEVIRGEKGFWDKFDITFEAFENAEQGNNYYSVVTYVEDYITSRRSYGNSEPPDETYFNIEVDSYSEAVATSKLSESPAYKGDCRYEEEGFLEDIQDSEKREKMLRRMGCMGQ